MVLVLSVTHLLLNPPPSPYSTPPVTVNAEEAKPAACKPRTEVMEVTRSMLDRRNADFLLLPYCVEVQRCSGCCNTRLIKCVPVRTTTRHLKVRGTQYTTKPHTKTGKVPKFTSAGFLNSFLSSK